MLLRIIGPMWNNLIDCSTWNFAPFEIISIEIVLNQIIRNQMCPSGILIVKIWPRWCGSKWIWIRIHCYKLVCKVLVFRYLDQNYFISFHTHFSCMITLQKFCSTSQLHWHFCVLDVVQTLIFIWSKMRFLNEMIQIVWPQQPFASRVQTSIQKKTLTSEKI